MVSFFTILPPSVSGVVVEPDNPFPGFHQVGENGDECMLLDNDLLYDIPYPRAVEFAKFRLFSDEFCAPLISVAYTRTVAFANVRFDC